MPPNMSAKSTISKRHMRRFHRQRPPQPPAWRARAAQAGLPQWIRPQTDRARRRLDWTHKYSPIAADVAVLGRARQAYLDCELCGVFPDGMIQAVSDAGNAAGLVSSSSTFCVSTATMSARCR